jgi:hypothetical protein
VADDLGLGASGAALLANHETRAEAAPMAATPPQPFVGDASALAAYARRWRDLANRQTSPKTA